MKTIKVFIASSDELELERLQFSDMILHLNRILKPRGVEIEPVKWEYLDASMGPLHKQEEYNKELKTCEMCLVLYWTKFGEYTKSEFDTAYSELCAGHNPKKLYVYFKNAEDITPELKTFKESFATSYGHFFCRFENVDTMRLNFLLQFEDYQNKASEKMLEVRDSRVEIDGKPFVELKNIPFAGKNPEYLQLVKQIESTQARVLKYPDDADFRQELHDLQERRKAMESSLLDTAKLITRLSSNTSSSRFLEAIRLFEAGDNKGANAILNLDEISNEAKANAARVDAAREIEAESIKALESNIDEYRLKIKTLQNAMEMGWVTEVIDVYDKAVNVARNRIAAEKFAKLLFDYAVFLYSNKQYHLIGTLYDESLSIYRKLAEKNPETYDCCVALTLNNLAGLHYITQRLDLAEKEYTEALDIRRRLAEKNSVAYKSSIDFLSDLIFNDLWGYSPPKEEKTYEEYESYVADTLNNLAGLHSDTQRLDFAEKEYTEALDIRRRLAEKNPEAYESDVALTLNNLALLHFHTQCLDSAEKEYTEALDIHRRLAEKNPEAYESYLANNLNNLAGLHSDTQRLDLAEKEYTEALDIRRRLAEKNPEAYESDVALTLNNLALLHFHTQCLDSAEKEYTEALDIHRRLAEKNPEAYESYLANNLNNLAGLHSDTQRLDLAEKEYTEALDIRRRLAEKKTESESFLNILWNFLEEKTYESYNGDVANTLNNLAVLHYDTQRLDLAEKEYTEALDIFRYLAKKNPKVYDGDVASTLNNLAVLHYDTQRLDLTEKEHTEALDIYRCLAERNPDAYESDVADTLNYLAILHSSTQRSKLAIKEFKEALSIYRRVAEYSEVSEEWIQAIESEIRELESQQ